MKKHGKRPAWIPALFSFLLLLGLGWVGYSIWPFIAGSGTANVSAHSSAKTATAHPSKQQQMARNEAPARKKAVGKFLTKEKAIDRILNQTGFSGTAVVVSHGQIVLDKGYGLSDLRTRKPNTVLTRYYIGSMTKAVTAAAFMQLRQHGWIDFATPVSQFYPNFPNGNRLQMIDLLDHVSGLGGDSESMQPLTRDQLVAKIARLNPKLRSKPGTVWSYQDTNYALLGAILDKICETHYHENLHAYIQQSIYSVAGMKNSGFGITGEQSANRSIPYLHHGKVNVEAYAPSFSQLLGCGDVYATSWDLYLFDHALATGHLMSSSSLHDLLKSRFHGTSYSMGWYLSRHGWGAGTNSSHGVLGGWNGSNAFSKDGQNYLILLSNIKNSHVQMAVLNRKIFAILSN